MPDCNDAAKSCTLSLAGKGNLALGTTTFSTPHSWVVGDEGTGGDPVAADFDGDERVGFYDLFLFADAFGGPSTQAVVTYLRISATCSG